MKTSFGIPPVRYDRPVRNDDVSSLRVTDLSSSTFVKVLEDLKQSASTFRDNTKIVKVHRVTVVKRRRPYQKTRSANLETSKVLYIVAESTISDALRCVHFIVPNSHLPIQSTHFGVDLLVFRCKRMRTQSSIWRAWQRPTVTASISRALWGWLQVESLWQHLTRARLRCRRWDAAGGAQQITL